jgi:hypothetical protein
VDRGSALERFVIGFRTGRSTLQVSAELERSDSVAGPPMTAFKVSGDSGYKLGLIAPGAGVLAGLDAVQLAVSGGIDVASGARGPMAGPVRATAAAFISQLEKYYDQVGWSWPMFA